MILSTTAARPVVLAPAGDDTTVLLIHSPYPARLRFDGLPSSLLSATALLVQRLDADCVRVGLMDPGSASEKFYEALERVLRSGAIRVVCISTSTAAIEETARIVRTVRAVCTLPPLIVVGGPHEDACRLKVAEAIDGVDVSVAGDAEYLLVALVCRFLRSPAGTHSVKGCLEEFASGPGPMRGRGSITSRAWGLPFSRPFDFGSTEVESFHTRCHVPRPVRFDVFSGRVAVPLTISRGCSYGRCTFCSEGGVGMRSEVVHDFAWIRELSERHPGVPLYFQDSIFPATRIVRQNLLPLLSSLGVEWGCQVYLPTLSRKLVADLAEHGCNYLYTGIESGSDDVLRSIGKTGLTRELILERLGWFAGHGVRAGLSLMFGAMSDSGQLLESEATVAETVSLTQEILAREVPVAGFYLNIQTVLPGTALDHALALRGRELNFYSMPKAGEFAAFEDGAVGHNFMTITRPSRQRSRVAARIVEAVGAIGEGVSARTG